MADISSSEPAAPIMVGSEPQIDGDALREKYLTVQDRIRIAAGRAGRDPAAVQLVAVSKAKPIALIAALYRLGHRHFGENRVGEGSEKAHIARASFAPEIEPITWHMIGHIQSRKAKLAAADFDVIQSVDRVKLARRLQRTAAELERRLPILLESNVSGEAAKHGLAADAIATSDVQWQTLVAEIAQIVELPNLEVRGLMTMAPIVAQAEAARPFFRRLRALRDKLRDAFPGARWDDLSMGMTDDFEVAIEEGATIVRVGRAIFGARD